MSGVSTASYDTITNRTTVWIWKRKRGETDFRWHALFWFRGRE